MEIGNNDFDYFDEVDDFEQQEVNPDPTPTGQDTEPVPTGEPEDKKDTSSEDDFIISLLKSRGIDDMSKIKFEDESGSVEELNWNNLSNEEKLNILNSSLSDPDKDLDDEEAQLINTIRKSGLTPAEYLEHLQSEGVNSYIQNNQNQDYQYQVDQYSDDELFLFDFMSRMGDVTNEEAQEALERAKSNETLFSKQIAAIRNEYKAIEEENLRQAQIEQEEQAKEQYNQFADQIANQIGEFTEFSGYDLNLDDDDRDTLYEFITGFDGAGNNHFAKALSDPKILVQTAWFALNGKQMMDDITSYFQNEIKEVRKESYEKGLADAKEKMKKNSVVFTDKQTGSHTEVFNDLDDF